MTLAEVSTGIIWQPNNFILTENQSTEAPAILLEYINSIDIRSIRSEISLLKRFQSLIKDKANIDEFILGQLEGYSSINGQVLAKIAGAHDLAPAIYYAPEHQRVILLHPNNSIIQIVEFPLDILIELLTQKMTILNTVKTQEKPM